MRNAAILGVLGALVGVWVGRAVPVGDVRSERVARAVRVAPSSALAPPSASCDDVLEAMDTLSRELALTQHLRQTQEEVVEGSPVSWPEETPPEHTEAGVRARLDEVVRRCGDGRLALADLECDEPPCVATFLLDDGRISAEFFDCGRDKGLSSFRSIGTSTRCAPGEPREVMTLALTWRRDEEDRDNAERRIDTRMKRARQAQVCP